MSLRDEGRFDVAVEKGFVYEREKLRFLRRALELLVLGLVLSRTKRAAQMSYVGWRCRRKVLSCCRPGHFGLGGLLVSSE